MNRASLVGIVAVVTPIVACESARPIVRSDAHVSIEDDAASSEPDAALLANDAAVHGDDASIDDAAIVVDAASTPDAWIPPDAAMPALDAASIRAWLGTCQPLAGTSRFASDSGGTANVDICAGPNGAIFWSSDFDIDCDGGRATACTADPYYMAETAGTTSTGAPLDASTLPFIVVPSPSSRWDFRDNQIRYGTVGVVLYGDRMEYAIVGDAGPTSIIGEGSYALAVSLGINPDPVRGGAGSGATFIVFPGLRVTRNENHAEAVSLGEARLRDELGL